MHKNTYICDILYKLLSVSGHKIPSDIDCLRAVIDNIHPRCHTVDWTENHVVKSNICNFRASCSFKKFFKTLQINKLIHFLYWYLDKLAKTVFPSNLQCPLGILSGNYGFNTFEYWMNLVKAQRDLIKYIYQNMTQVHQMTESAMVLEIIFLLVFYTAAL